MIKATILYGHPVDPAAFEEYYAVHHAPIAAQMKGLERMELTKFISAPDGTKAAYHRMAELYFTSPEALQKTMDSAEGKATLADLANFATGGVTSIVGVVG